MSTSVTSTGMFSCCQPKFTDRSQIPSNSSVFNNPHRHQSDVEALLVQGMNDLSFDELQREQEDLHGIYSGSSKSTTDAADELLNSMNAHLDLIKADTAYGRAEAKDPEYVRKRDFQIIFLKGNRNDPKAAAEQIVRYYDVKQELFGEESLCRDITTEDLTEEDMDSVMRGSIQMASCTDMAGRVILWSLPALRPDDYSVFHELRARLFMGTNMAQSMDDPGRGAVVVCYLIGDIKDHSKGAAFKQNIKLALALPYHIAGFHLCFSNPAQTLLAKAAVALMPPQARAKTKVHYGSNVECQYFLSTYGIPREALPFNQATNEVDLTSHKRWVLECRLREVHRNNTDMPNIATIMSRNNNASNEASTASNRSDARNSKGGNKNLEFLRSIWKGETPMENDVLCVGRKVNGQGNDRLVSLAMMHAEAYDGGTTMERKVVVNTIMEEIWSHGGRFLKLDTTNDKGWVKLGDTETREKICQTFRNLRPRRVSRQSKGALNGGDKRSGRVSPDKCTSGATPSDPAIIVEGYKAVDVLFGKLKDHEGNQYLRELVEGIAAQYDTANRGEKSKLADQIMAKVRERGGRFLKPVDDGRWEVVSDKDAAKKIGHHFRNLRRKQWR